MCTPRRPSPTGAQPERSGYSSVLAILLTAVCRRKSRLQPFWRPCLYSSAAVVVLACATPTHGQPSSANGVPVAASRFEDFVNEASQRFAVPASWIRAVMRVESFGDPRALSPKGAMGLMQIMPDTWSELRSRHGLGADPYDPRDNVIAGAAYLRELHDRYGEGGFLAAYNAGPKRYEDHLTTGRPLPAETVAYMAAVRSLIGVHSDDSKDVSSVSASSWTSAPLFVARPVGDKAPNRTVLTPLADGLFAKPSTRNRQP
jgi:soluble lytic murein transglycosylase-like protein